MKRKCSKCIYISDFTKPSKSTCKHEQSTNNLLINQNKYGYMTCYDMRITNDICGKSAKLFIRNTTSK